MSDLILAFSNKKIEIQFTRDAKPREFWADQLNIEQSVEVQRTLASGDTQKIETHFRDILAARAVNKKPITDEEIKRITPSVITALFAKLNGSDSENPKLEQPPKQVTGG